MSLSEFKDQFRSYRNTDETMQKVKLAMYLPGKQKKQSIINMVYTATRMKFTPYCIAKTLSKIYHVSERTIYRYCARQKAIK